MAQEVYVVIEFDRETDEFSEVEGVFQSKEEAEDYAKVCSARYLRYSYGCYEGTYDADEVDAVLAEKESENESLLQQNRELCQALQVMYSKEAYDKQKHKRCLWLAKWCCDRWADIATPYNKSVWYRKWELRWLELAEKFKEAK